MFISNAHPKLTLALLPPEALRPAYLHRVEGMRESISCLGGYFTSQERSVRRLLYVVIDDNGRKGGRDGDGPARVAAGGRLEP